MFYMYVREVLKWITILSKKLFIANKFTGIQFIRSPEENVPTRGFQTQSGLKYFDINTSNSGTTQTALHTYIDTYIHLDVLQYILQTDIIRTYIKTYVHKNTDSEFMYVCMYVCMRISMYVLYIYVCLYVCTV